MSFAIQNEIVIFKFHLVTPQLGWQRQICENKAF